MVDHVVHHEGPHHSHARHDERELAFDLEGPLSARRGTRQLCIEDA